ncbi:VOC family protein [Nocardia callitridis]|uniref:VOC family protein n=1 Tax=Nocardia callitridis TaxID=648753 RepID=A0ABP9K4G5_9NOCA
MQATAFAVSLNVAEPAASARFLIEHLGFTEQMSADGFVSLVHEGARANVIYLRTGLSSFKPASAAGSAGDGLLIVLIVEDIDTEYARLRDAGVPIVTPIETEEWGERYFQMSDPNGVIIQLVQWV